jgi:hypothetical protein
MISNAFFALPTSPSAYPGRSTSTPATSERCRREYGYGSRAIPGGSSSGAPIRRSDARGMFVGGTTERLGVDAFNLLFGRAPAGKHRRWRGRCAPACYTLVAASALDNAGFRFVGPDRRGGRIDDPSWLAATPSAGAFSFWRGPSPREGAARPRTVLQRAVFRRNDPGRAGWHCRATILWLRRRGYRLRASGPGEEAIVQVEKQVDHIHRLSISRDRLSASPVC